MCCSPWGRKELDMTERLNSSSKVRTERQLLKAPSLSAAAKGVAMRLLSRLQPFLALQACAWRAASTSMERTLLYKLCSEGLHHKRMTASTPPPEVITSWLNGVNFNSMKSHRS